MVKIWRRSFKFEIGRSENVHCTGTIRNYRFNLPRISQKRGGCKAALQVVAM
jgi:hypothetical protein